MVNGFVVGIAPKQTTINSPCACIIKVKWKDDRLPDGVKIGERVCVVGEFHTLNLGRGFFINNGEAVQPTRMREFKRYLKGEKE